MSAGSRGPAESKGLSLMSIERLKMAVFQGDSGQRRLICGLAGALILHTFSAAAWAGDDRFYVLRDGRRIRLHRSDSHFGVTLRDRSEADVCAHRLASQGRGIVEPVKGAPHARVKLLRVAEATTQRRNLALQDPSIVEVRAVYRFEGSEDPVISTGTIAAKVQPDLSDYVRGQIWSDYGLEAVYAVDGLPDVYCVKPVEGDGDEVLAAELLADDARVVWAQPNFRRSPKLRQIVPTDEYFDLQWHLSNRGQSGGSVDADIGATQAWLIAKGQNILIGMFDDACDVDHEDLAENYIDIGHDATLESTDPGFTDPRPKVFDNKHGTAVMGLACARANSVGGLGVAPYARFTASRGFGDEVLSDLEISLVFLFARQQDVDVHMNSWGLGRLNSAPIVEAIEVAFEQGRPVGDDPDDDKLGMVIVWAAGNGGTELQLGDDYSTLPQVIGVGASTHADQRASYSNFGVGINMLAPSGADSTGLVGALVTTDNTDRPGAVDNGYNVDGSELDIAGRYTNTFTGTSGACPIAAGVAALVLSKNPTLTAIDVRLIMEHTCDQISPVDADYHPVTNRSRTYGYGRINANRAVTAAQETLINGGFTWPDRPALVTVEDSRIRWLANAGTSEFLIVQSDSDLAFIPKDLDCYDRDQAFCGSIDLSSLPAGVEVLDVVKCTGTCAANSERSVSFEGSGSTHFGLYARSAIGRYSYGVYVPPDGNVLDSGPVFGSFSDSGTEGPQEEHPFVTIDAIPLEGTSPLTVQFSGNAVSSITIDESRTSWDFDISDGVGVDSTDRSVLHTYTADAGEAKVFTARLTMYDVEGNWGYAEVTIQVEGAGDNGSGGLVGDTDINIIVGVPGTPGSDVDQGVSPFEVELSVSANLLAGTLQSVVWDLGDGIRATSIVVPHTYGNETGLTLRLAITATATFLTTGGATVTSTASRTITVLPGVPFVEPPPPLDFGPQGSGSSGPPCGVLGLAPLFVMMAAMSLAWVRRFRN